MSKRNEYDSTETAVVETLRSASNKPVEAAPQKNDEEKMSLFWRVFGGTIISVAALTAITLFNTMNNGISELRAEGSRLKEETAALRARADDNRREIDSLKERLSKYRQENDANKRDHSAATDAVRKEVAATADAVRKEVEAAKKESAASTDGVKKDLIALEKDLHKALTDTREKIARLEGQQTPMKPVPPPEK